MISVFCRYSLNVRKLRNTGKMLKLGKNPIAFNETESIYKLNMKMKYVSENN